MGGGAWLVYAAAVLGRLVWKWSVTRASSLALNGFVIIMALLLVSAALS
jgi:hypothetical protein